MYKSIKAAPNVMLPILFYWLMTAEVNVGGMEVELEPSINIPLHFVAYISSKHATTTILVD